MTLERKLAFDYAESRYNMYGPNGEGIIAEEAYLAGFQKAKDIGFNEAIKLALGICVKYGRHTRIRLEIANLMKDRS